MSTRVVIVDDEPLARGTLREFLSDVEWIEIVGEAGDGISAVAALDTLRPDLVFLDVVMPGANGIEVLQRAHHRPHVVFTTAYERFAVTAFELGAVDYLLKPFTRERMLVVLERVRTTLDQEGYISRAAELLSDSRPLERLFIRESARIIPILVERIERLQACDDYVAVHVAGKRYLLHVRLKDLVTRLDRRFAQVHRSHVINLDYVSAFEEHDRGRLEVVLRNGERIVASRTGTQLLRSMFDAAR